MSAAREAKPPGAPALRVAVVGAGPAGATLALLLARRGARVTMFDDGRRPELLVGESLIPAIVPMLRRLGIEEDAAAVGRRKPGVSFLWSATDRFSFTFERFAPAVFPYAFYAGQMMALMRAGQDWMRTRSGAGPRAAQRHMERQVALLASGLGATGRYSRALVRFLSRHALRGVEPGPLAIR